MRHSLGAMRQAPSARKRAAGGKKVPREHTQLPGFATHSLDDNNNTTMREIRYSKRQVHVAVLLLLAGVFLWQGTRSLNGDLISAPPMVQGDLDTNCHWEEEGGPVLYVAKHSKTHPDGKCGR